MFGQLLHLVLDAVKLKNFLTVMRNHGNIYSFLTLQLGAAD